MWNQENAPRLGASLAFYTILSISPRVILVVAIVSVVFSRSSPQALLLAQAKSLIGAGGKDAIEATLASGQKHSSGILSSVFGVVTLLIGASTVFSELRAALNAIWRVEPAKTDSGLWALAHWLESAYSPSAWYSALALSSLFPRRRASAWQR